MIPRSDRCPIRARSRYDRRIAAVVLAVVLGLSGCSGDEQVETGTPADPEHAAALAAYEEYWTVLLASSDPADPESGALEGVATTPEIERARAVLADRKQAGEVVRGSYAHDASVADMQDDVATVVDCLSVQTQTFDASGKLLGDDPPGPYPVSVSMRQIAGSWMVADVAEGDHTCPPPSASAPVTTGTP